jgi:Lrp/AsnC family transcriptional regulator for asnA, asnC and gidA
MKENDHIDEQLIHLLEGNAQQSSEALAKHLNVSSATVRRRLKKLIDSGHLHIVAYRDPVKAGLPVAAVIGFNIDHELLDSAMQAICSHPEVVLACTTTGRFDAFALTRFSSNEEFSSFLRNEVTKIEGVKDSETFVCLHIEKRGLFC